MPGILKRIWHMMNADLLRREEHRQLLHPVFGMIHYFGRRGEVDNYWEVEYTPSGFSHPTTVIIPSNGDPPTADLALTQSLLLDVDGLTARCRRAIIEHSQPRVDATHIDDLRFVGLELPRHAVLAGPWTVTHCAVAKDHWFTVEFVGEEARGVEVSG